MYSNPVKILDVQHLTLAIDGREILSAINLTVNAGEVHALLGGNGAGKSSLAYAIMGCSGYRPSSGSILFDGRPITDEPIHRRAQAGITLAWQEPARFEGLTVRDYLRLGRPERDPEKSLKRVGLAPEDYLDRPVDKTLSGGERKRIELAAVLAMKPRLAILDEPTAGIDLASLDTIAEVIESLTRHGSAVLLITHREDLALRADCATQLCDGQVICEGPASVVTQNYKRHHCHQCDGRTCRDE